MASRKLLGPSTAVYQAGRGSEPMMEVGRAIPADALYIVFLACWASPAFPAAEGRREGSEIVGFALRGRVFHQRVVGLGQRRARVAEAVDDGVAAVAAEVLQRYLDAGRRLPALVLGEIEHALDLHDRLAVEAVRDDLGDRLFALDQPFEDLVEYVVGWQRVLVGLVLAQLGGGRTGENIVGNDLRVWPERAVGLPAVAQPRQPINFGLVEVLDRVEAAVHVAIERGIADRHFRFIAGGHHHQAELVGDRHQDGAARPRL